MSEMNNAEAKKAVGICPVCGSDVVESGKGWFCSNKDCHFGFWKNNAYFSKIGNTLTETMVEELRQLWLKKTPVSFTAAGDSYENMCITSITAPRTVEDGSSTRLTIKLKQASINSTDMANISVKYIRGGTSKKNTGAGQKSSSSTSGTQKDEKATKSSILCSGAKAIGLFK